MNVTEESLKKEKERLQEKLASMSQVVEELSKGYKEPGAVTKDVEEKVGFEIKGVKDALETLDKKLDKSVKKQELTSAVKKEVEDALDPIKDQINSLQKLTDMEQRLKAAEEKLAQKQIPQEILTMQKLLEGFTPQDLKRVQSFADSADMLIRSEVKSEVKRRFLEMFKEVKDVQEEMTKLAEQLESNIEEIEEFDKRLEEVTAVKKRLEKFGDDIKKMDENAERRILEVYKKQGERVMVNMLKEMFPQYIEPRFKENREDMEKWVADVFYKTNKSVDLLENSLNLMRKDLDARIRELAEMKKVASMVSSSLSEAKSHTDYEVEKTQEKNEAMLKDKFLIIKKELDRSLANAVSGVAATELRISQSSKTLHKRLDMADREASRQRELISSIREESGEASEKASELGKSLEDFEGTVEDLNDSIEDSEARIEKLSSELQSVKSSIAELKRLVKEVAE